MFKRKTTLPSLRNEDLKLVKEETETIMNNQPYPQRTITCN